MQLIEPWNVVFTHGVMLSSCGERFRDSPSVYSAQMLRTGSLAAGGVISGGVVAPAMAIAVAAAATAVVGHGGLGDDLLGHLEPAETN